MTKNAGRHPFSLNPEMGSLAARAMNKRWYVWRRGYILRETSGVWNDEQTLYGFLLPSASSVTRGWMFKVPFLWFALTVLDASNGLSCLSCSLTGGYVLWHIAHADTCNSARLYIHFSFIHKHSRGLNCCPQAFPLKSVETDRFKAAAMHLGVILYHSYITYLILMPSYLHFFICKEQTFLFLVVLESVHNDQLEVFQGKLMLYTVQIPRQRCVMHNTCMSESFPLPFA